MVAGVNCQHEGYINTLFSITIIIILSYHYYSIDPPQFSVRLIGGSTRYEGRLQTFFNSKWGSVCNNEWDFNDARVTCRQLGFSDALMAVTSLKYGNADEEEEYFLDSVKCSGDEPGLHYCESSGFGNQACGISEVAGVVCTGLCRICLSMQ